MKRWISFIIILLCTIQVQARQSARHAVRIIILQPNHFEISRQVPETPANHVDVQKNNQTNLTLDWRTSSTNKRITVASLDNDMNGSLRLKCDKEDLSSVRVDESHKELTDYLTDRKGKLQLQWIADAGNHSVQQSGIVYTLTDSL